MVGMDVSELFPVNIEMVQGCMMSPWLFNVCKVGVVRDVYARVLGKGPELLQANGVRFKINQLLSEDATVLVADSEEKLCIMLSEFGKVCERRSI